METNQDTIQDLGKCTVAIKRTDGGGKVLGTGVIVTDNGLILTCYHVIGDHVHKKIIDKEVDIYFPSIPEIKGHAYVVEEYCDPDLDIAILELQEKKIPAQTISGDLGKTVHPKEHRFQSFGFRNPIEIKFEGLPANGIIQGKTRLESRDGILSPLVIVLKSNQIGKGMSGSPVLDTETNKIIGIISDHYKAHYSMKDTNIYETLSLAIPISTIIEVCPVLEDENIGLKKIFEFLRKIEKEGVKKYASIDELYVQPINYEEIEQALYNNKVLFITGTQEYGKTYTAVYLLWEYFKKGYEPIWFKALKKEDRSSVRDKFADVERFARRKTIIYFEDPFGKAEYEVSSDETIVGDISSIVDTVKNTLQDTFVIITSRDEVFKNFDRKITAEIELEKFEKKITVKTPSYDFEKRKQILINHSAVRKCDWLRNDALYALVLETLKDTTKLTSPLKMEQFATATAGKQILDKDNILHIMDIKSLETYKEFGEEIKLMTEDKILFLSFPFISERFPKVYAKDVFQQLVNELPGIKDPWKFETLLDWFKNDKIDIMKDTGYIEETGKSELMSFSHPSYSEGMRYALTEKDGNLTNVGQIVCSAISKLATYNEETGLYVVYCVGRNFDILPESTTNLILKLADSLDKDAVFDAAVETIHKLPDTLKDIMFPKLIDSESAANYFVTEIADDVHFIGEEARNYLLLKLADNEWTAKTIYNYILNGLFVGLPSNLKEQLLEIADKKYH